MLISRRLAWSKLGCIAQLSDGKIIFRAVVRNQETGLWSLSPEQPRPIVAPQGVTFVHIEFSSLGLDLVAFDQHGYPHVYTISFALDRMNPQPVNAAHLRDDMNVVVGIYWLPMYPGQFKVGCHTILRRSISDSSRAPSLHLIPRMATLGKAL